METGCWYIGCSLCARHICRKRDAGNYQNSVDVKTSVDWRKIHQILRRQDLKKKTNKVKGTFPDLSDFTGNGINSDASIMFMMFWMEIFELNRDQTT